MTDITIPPAALEAGARAIHGFWFEYWAIRWDDLEPYDKDQFRGEARAAFLAIVEAWPGAFEEYMNIEEGRAVVCMILPKGGDDDKA